MAPLKPYPLVLNFFCLSLRTLVGQAFHSETKDSEQSQEGVLPTRGAVKMVLSTGLLEKPLIYM